MNKTELIGAVAEKSGLSKKDAEKAASALFDAVTEALVAGDKVSVIGFGSFETKNRAERTARNPRDGSTVVVPATRHVVFKAGKGLKDAVTK